MKFYQQKLESGFFRLKIISLPDISYKERKITGKCIDLPKLHHFNGLNLAQLHPVLQFKSWKSCYFLPNYLADWEMGTSGRLRHAAAGRLCRWKTRERLVQEMALATSLRLSDGQIPSCQCLCPVTCHSGFEGIQPNHNISQYQYQLYLAMISTIDALDIFKLDFVLG